MLEIINISKDFRGVHALKNTNATFYEKEIHGLVGENGAGKSTMMKIVCGLFKPTNGHVKLDGKLVTFHTPHDAYKAGIRIVHQELSLIRSLSIAENIYIHKYEKGKLLKKVDRKKLVKDAEKILKEWDIQIDASERVAQVSMGIRQLVEIARELSTGGKVIILDEPTSSLTVSEIKKLFEVVRKLKEQGLTIIFISHRLDEVTKLVDRLTVLRDGVVVGCAPTKDMSPSQICTMIAGTDISNLYPKSEADIGEIALKAENFTGKGFNNISLNVRWGEIVGLVGLVGAGRSEVCRAIFGLDKCYNSILYIKGEKVHIKNTGIAVKKRIALLSEDREAEGIFPELSVALNVIMLKIKNILKNNIINKKLLCSVANEKVEELNIVTFNSEKQIVSELS